MLNDEKVYGWKSYSKDGYEIIERKTKETIVILKFNPNTLHLTINANGDDEHHLKEDVAIVALKFAPHHINQ